MPTETVGFVGMGKLGTPLAVALARRHPVIAHDAVPELNRKRVPWPHQELGPYLRDDFQGLYAGADITFVPDPGTLAERVGPGGLIFVAVQTPHGPEYEGVTRVPETRADFDYTHLRVAARALATARRPGQIIVIVSTVLPGTLRREVVPILGGTQGLVYNPCFAAMTQVMHDFLDPEFVLLGGDDLTTLDRLERFYDGLLTQTWGNRGEDSCCPPIHKVSLESAELAKVVYNTYVTAKITISSTVMEVCHKTPGANVDEVSGVLKTATRRILGPSYMDGGVGDGGPCHPRDGIAMSFLAEELSLSFDLFGQLMLAREAQAQWLANLAASTAQDRGLPLVLLGKAYKPGTALTAGSCALLVANLLRERGQPFEHYDPLADRPRVTPPMVAAATDEERRILYGDPNAPGPQGMIFMSPRVFLIATKHEVFRRYQFAPGSVVLDTFRYLPDQEGVEIVRVGVGGSS